MEEVTYETERKPIVDNYLVEIFNEDDGAVAKIGANSGTLIEQIITEMYRDFSVDRQPNDRLRCRGTGADVFPFAAQTMRQYLESGSCPELKWDFAAETGGA